MLFVAIYTPELSELSELCIDFFCIFKNIV